MLIELTLICQVSNVRRLINVLFLAEEAFQTLRVNGRLLSVQVLQEAFSRCVAVLNRSSKPGDMSVQVRLETHYSKKVRLD